LRMP